VVTEISRAKRGERLQGDLWDRIGVIARQLVRVPRHEVGALPAMLAVQPLYGWMASRLHRNALLPQVYGFFRRCSARLPRSRGRRHEAERAADDITAEPSRAC
jgi:hypothetical protein